MFIKRIIAFLLTISLALIPTLYIVGCDQVAQKQEASMPKTIKQEPIIYTEAQKEKLIEVFSSKEMESVLQDTYHTLLSPIIQSSPNDIISNYDRIEELNKITDLNLREKEQTRVLKDIGLDINNIASFLTRSRDKLQILNVDFATGYEETKELVKNNNKIIDKINNITYNEIDKDIKLGKKSNECLEKIAGIVIAEIGIYVTVQILQRAEIIKCGILGIASGTLLFFTCLAGVALAAVGVLIITTTALVVLTNPECRDAAEDVKDIFSRFSEPEPLPSPSGGKSYGREYVKSDDGDFYAADGNRYAPTPSGFTDGSGCKNALLGTKVQLTSYNKGSISTGLTVGVEVVGYTGCG